MVRLGFGFRVRLEFGFRVRLVFRLRLGFGVLGLH